MIFFKNIIYFLCLYTIFVFYNCIKTKAFAQTPSVIINELMVNPNNATLPRYEYIELHNPGKENINLRGFKINVNQRSFVLPEFILSKGQYVILTQKERVSEFTKYGNTIGIENWPAVHNQEASLSLLSDQDSLIEEFRYSHMWHDSATKRRGGWSLERINPNIPCHIPENWSSSIAKTGGSPGAKNSLYHSKKWPEIQLDILEVKAHTLTLRVHATLIPEKIELFPEIGHNSHIESRGTDTLVLHFGKEILKNKAYLLKSEAIQCGTDKQRIETPVFAPEYPDYNDIVISEILPHPKDKGVKFVEIYNTSNHTFDLSHWYLGNRPISPAPYYIYPDEYKVLTTDKNRLQGHYPNTRTENVLEMPSLPPFYSQRGEVTLFYQDKQIDSLHYTDDFHQPFIKNTKGISLERQDLWSPTHQSGNFTSASTLIGGATPGYENSKNKDEFLAKNSFDLVSKVFAPHVPGQDRLILKYQLIMDNPMCDFYIYNDKGILVKRLHKNQSLGTKGEIHWFGEDDYNRLCPSGIYIYVAEIFNNLGERERFKGSFVFKRAEEE